MTLEPSTDEFWEALDSGRFLVGRCPDCEAAFFPPRTLCPDCAAEAGTEASPGRGRLYSFTRQHRTAPGFDAPLVIGLVELEEGPRVLVGVDAAYDGLEIGDAVEIRPVAYEGGVDRGRLAEAPFFEAVPR